MQEIQVRSLVWGDPTCLRAATHMYHSLGAWEPLGLCSAMRDATSMTRLHATAGEWPLPAATRESLQGSEDPAQQQIDK